MESKRVFFVAQLDSKATYMQYNTLGCPPAQ